VAHGHGEAHSTYSFKALLIGSIGVVYGDIGTSPLYAFREAVVASSGSAGTVTTPAVLGGASMLRVAPLIAVGRGSVLIEPVLRPDALGGAVAG